MPIFEVLGGTRSVNNTLDYCEKETITIDEVKINKCVLKAGVNCDIQDIRTDFAETRQYFNKQFGRQGIHFILSFSPKELPNTLDNQQKCLDIGIDLAEKIAKEHESGVFVHVDQDHLHCHIVTNAVAFQNGEKYHMEKNKDLVVLRNLSDQICTQHGITPLEAYKGSKQAETSVEKRIKGRKGVTWKGEIVEAVQFAKEKALSETHFKELLAEKGIETYRRGKKTFGYEHTGQRDAGKTKFRMRDDNKALEGNHYEDILSFIKKKSIKKVEPEKEAPPVKQVVTIALPPVTDNFEETIEQNQLKKADIKAKTSRELEDAATEERRTELKEKEAFELHQAELEKEIRLKEAAFYTFIRKIQDLFPLAVSTDVEEKDNQTSFYFGGGNKKLFKVTLEREAPCLSFAKRDHKYGYEEQDVAFLKDNEESEKMYDFISKQASQQEKKIKLYRYQSRLER